MPLLAALSYFNLTPCLIVIIAHHVRQWSGHRIIDNEKKEKRKKEPYSCLQKQENNITEGFVVASEGRSNSHKSKQTMITALCDITDS